MTTLGTLKARMIVLQSCMEIERKADGAVSKKTKSDYELILTQLNAAEIQLGVGTMCDNQWLLE